jgi:5'-deoxynucleotidase
MKYISRWSLMRNTLSESLSQHTLETVILSHALAVIHNERFGGSINAEHIAMLALYHDASEIITGDLPTPIKYYNEVLRSSYREVEEMAADKLTDMLPPYLQGSYSPLLHQKGSAEELRFVKAADKLSALIKCLEEKNAGNLEFSSAEQSTMKALKNMEMPEVEVFFEEFIKAYTLTLDQQG